MEPLSDEQRQMVEGHYKMAWWFACQKASRAREILYWADSGDVLVWLLDYAVDALIGASLKYDASRGVKFSTYAGECIKGALRRCVRDNLRWWNREGAFTNMDWAMENSRHMSHESMSLIQARELLAALPEIHAVIVELLSQGCTQDDVAAILGTNQMFVSRKLAEVRNTMESWNVGVPPQIVEDGASLARHLERRLPVRLTVRAVNANTLSVSDGEVERQFTVALPADVNAVIDQIRQAFGLGKGKS